MFELKPIRFALIAIPTMMMLFALSTLAQDDQAKSSRNRSVRPIQELDQGKLQLANQDTESSPAKSSPAKSSPAKRSLQDQGESADPSSQQESTQPKTTQPKTTQPKTTQPKTQEAKTQEAKTQEATSPQPATPQNAATQSGATQSGATQSGATQSGAANQAPANSSPVTTLSPEAREALNSYLSTPRRVRLGRQPRMFGDWFNGGNSVLAFTDSQSPSEGLFSAVQMATAGAGRVGKISENNHALPYDRVFVNYSYFHNAFEGGAIGPDAQLTLLDLSLERWTVGFEKTFWDGLASLETRFVLSDVPDFGHNPVGAGANGIQASNPTMGNLAFISKFLLFENASTAIAAGASLELPTGGDSFVQSGLTRLELENQAAFISPYIGILKKPTDSPWFANLFVQIETPLSGDGMTISDLTSNASKFLGRVNPQTNLFVDLGVGRWLYQNPNSFVSGVAMFAEAHYNAALNDADGVDGEISADGFFSDYYINYEDPNKYEVVDLTVGLHLEWNRQTKLRLGGVFPVSKDRTFDGEFGFQLTRVFGN